MTATPDPATATATAPPGGSAIATSIQPVPTTSVVEHGEPSSLPELNWFWRRVFVFALTSFLCWLIWHYMGKASDTTVRAVLKGALLSIDLLVLVYIVGASAEKVVQIVAAFKSTRKETVMAGSATGAPAAQSPPAAGAGGLDLGKAGELATSAYNRVKAAWPK